MAMLDIFNNAAFNTIALTDAINVKPNMFGTLQQLGIFPAQGVRQTHVAVEFKNFVLNLLPTTLRGGPATKGTIGKRTLQNISIPTIAHEDLILAADVDGVRAFGSETELETVQDLVVEKMDTMTSKHDITLEYMRWGALKGHVMDADGTTELLDIFSTFGVTQTTQDFALSGSANVISMITTLKRYFETHLFGDTMSGVRIFASSGWFDAFVSNASVKTAYQYFMQNVNPLNQDLRSGFNFGGVLIQEENGSATDIAGNVRAFVPANEAIAIPTGTNGTFKTYFAPADFIETVNTPGLPRYAKQKRMDYDRGIEIHTQSNPLPICLRPQLLVRLTKS